MKELVRAAISWYLYMRPKTVGCGEWRGSTLKGSLACPWPCVGQVRKLLVQPLLEQAPLPMHEKPMLYMLKTSSKILLLMDDYLKNLTIFKILELETRTNVAPMVSSNISRKNPIFEVTSSCSSRRKPRMKAKLDATPMRKAFLRRKERANVTRARNWTSDNLITRLLSRSIMQPGVPHHVLLYNQLLPSRLYPLGVGRL